MYENQNFKKCIAAIRVPKILKIIIENKKRMKHVFLIDLAKN